MANGRYDQNDVYWDMVDDKGLMQGGRRGRAFGRVRDWWEDNVADPSGATDRAAVRTLSNRMGQEIDYPSRVNEPGAMGTMKRGVAQFLGDIRGTEPSQEYGTYDVNQNYSMARDFALDFDPSDPNQVRILQQRMNLVGGLTDEPLSEDGILGPQTQAALDKLQASMPYQGQSQDQGRSYGFNEMPGEVSSLSMEENVIDENPYFGSLLNRSGRNILNR
tara:strand:+ start:314 stop:970 length:657 start_codon:yes stop_codon:yes gene_type:complete